MGIGKEGEKHLRPNKFTFAVGFYSVFPKLIRTALLNSKMLFAILIFSTELLDWVIMDPFHSFVYFLTFL